MLLEQVAFDVALCKEFATPLAEYFGWLELEVFLKDVLPYILPCGLVGAAWDETWMSFLMTRSFSSIFWHLRLWLFIC